MATEQCHDVTISHGPALFTGSVSYSKVRVCTYLEDLGAIHPNACALSHNLRRVHEILKCGLKKMQAMLAFPHKKLMLAKTKAE
jgi:hypothetical protein